MEIDQFNDYLIQVANLNKSSIIIKIAELEKIISAYKEKEGIDDINIDTILNEYSIKDLVNYVIEVYSESEILNQFDKDDIMKEIGKSTMVDYLKDDYFIADDEDEAVEILTDGGYLETDLDCVGNRYSNLRKDDCMELIADIVKREGWGYLYNQLEVEKEKLHLV